MIDFSTLKGLTIPEGNVTEITDESGNVLWSAGVTITIEGNGGEYASVVIDGVTYNTATTIKVPKGTVIACVAKGFVDKRIITCNYEKVGSGYDVALADAQYEYTVVSDATINLTYATARPGYTDTYYYYGTINIVDENAPPMAIINITMGGSAPPNATGGSVVVNGTYYAATTKVVAPIGTVVICNAGYLTRYMASTPTGGTITLNGEVVAERADGVANGTTTYEHTVLGDVDITIVRSYIQMSQYGGMGACSDINITEL